VSREVSIGAINSHIGLKAKNIVGTPQTPAAIFLGCLAFGCGQVQSSVVDIRASSIAYLSIAKSSNSTISVHGTIHAPQRGGVDINSNADLTLGAPLIYGDVDWVSVNDNTFASPPALTIGNEVAPRDRNTTNLGLVSIQRNTGVSLPKLSMGDIAGDLTIASNHGFSDGDALNFADAPILAGVVSISANAPGRASCWAR